MLPPRCGRQLGAQGAAQTSDRLVVLDDERADAVACSGIASWAEAACQFAALGGAL
jgi:hypothetical protein